MLTVLDEHESRNGTIYWHCKCDCGNDTWVSNGNLSSGEVKSCGCLGHKWQREKAKKLIGKKFNKLTILNILPFDKNKKGIYFECECDCGNPNHVFVNSANLLSGHTKSCGCLAHQYNGYLEDMIGKNFGKLTVISQNLDNYEGQGQRYWNCLCECGNKKILSTRDLNSGKYISCGCAKKSQINKGDKFGKLTVIDTTEKRASNGCIVYKCKCECGNTCEVPSFNLMRGDWKSCGCMKNKSYGEDNIAFLLSTNNIPFEQYKEYDNLKAANNRKYQFDFYVNNSYIIEFDGSQHFKYSGSGWDTKEHFEQTRRRDLIKNQYCFNNNIPIIRIPYNKEYTIDDLILEKTHYLLTKENENDYYKNN